MNTDRELLELAALATGRKFHVSQSAMPGLLLDDLSVWNPRDDSRDAFHLAVDICLFVDMQMESVLVGWVVDKDSLAIETLDEDKGNDPYATTRRAILRAAAAIGQSMKEQGK